MAGSIVPTTKAVLTKGMQRVKAVITCDASGVATATQLPEAMGKLVGIALPNGTLDMGNVIFTITDAASGAAVATIDTDVFKFGSTTTGDTTGGAAENLWTTGANHGLVVGDIIRFIAITGGGTAAVATDYAVKTVPSATTFTLSSTALAAGAELEIGAADVTVSSWVKRMPRQFRPTPGHHRQHRHGGHGGRLPRTSTATSTWTAR
jgi:hypothetical protein